MTQHCYRNSNRRALENIWISLIHPYTMTICHLPPRTLMGEVDKIDVGTKPPISGGGCLELMHSRLYSSPPFFASMLVCRSKHIWSPNGMDSSCSAAFDLFCYTTTSLPRFISDRSISKQSEQFLRRRESFFECRMRHFLHPRSFNSI